MNRVVEIIAPRTWFDAVFKGAAFVVAVNLLDYIVTVYLQRMAYTVATDLMPTTFTALPFIILAMLALRHQRELQDQLTIMASTDMLTGLPNRRAFITRTTAATRNGQQGALFLLDADHFKKINDTYGHAVGDKCLLAIGERLRSILRPNDIVGRFGGEEFSIFLPEVTVAQAKVIGERLCALIAVPEDSTAADIQVTLSIGAVFCDNHTPFDKLMAKADAALYRAKADGRARMVLAT